MEFKGYKLSIIIIVVVSIIILFFGGQYLYSCYSIRKPLKEKLLSLQSVSSVDIEANQGKTDLLVSFEKDVNFYESYKSIDQIINDRLGENKGKIIIDNEETQEINDLYYELQFSIYEGIATKKFVNMKKNIDAIISLTNNDYRLWIDDKAVYLKLDNKESSYYKRIPYISNNEGGENLG